MSERFAKYNSISDTQNIPFSDELTVVAEHDVTGNITITPNTTNAIAGGGAIQRVVADGVSTVDYSAFKELSTSGGFLNVAGAVNIFVFYFDGTNYNVAISQNGATVILPQAEVTAWVTRLASAGYTINSARHTAYDAFIFALKTNGIYSLINEMWMFEGGTAATNVLGFKNVSNAVIHGSGLTHQSTGSTGDGVASYMDLGVSPDNVGSASMTIAALLRKTNDTSNGYVVGSISGSSYTYISPRAGASYYGVAGYQSGFAAQPGNITNGRFIASRQTTELDLLINGVLKDSQSISSTVLANANSLFAFAVNQPGFIGSYSAQEIGFVMLSTGLTLGQAYILDAAMAALFTALGR